MYNTKRLIENLTPTTGHMWIAVLKLAVVLYVTNNCASLYTSTDIANKSIMNPLFDAYMKQSIDLFG